MMTNSRPRRLLSMRTLRTLFAVAVGLGLPACETASDGGGGAPPAAAAPISDTLAEGDVISVTFASAPELNQTQKIRGDGNVGLPMVGDVKVVGRDPESVQKQLSKLYATHLQDPTALVTLVAPASVVYVSGAVGSPGKIPLDRPLSAFEAVMESGGFAPTANPKKVTLIRKTENGYRRHVLDLRGPLESESSEAIMLQAYDSLVVPQRVW